MRVLHTADWHFGKTLEGRSRIEEQAQFVDELVEIVKAEDVQFVLMAGDAFDTSNPPAAADELFYDALDRLADGGRRAVLVIAGNHDNPDRLCAAAPLAARHGVMMFGVPTDTARPMGGGGNATAGTVQGVTGGDGGVRLLASGPSWVELAVRGCDHPVIVLAVPYPSESRLNEILQDNLDEETLQLAYSDRVGRLFSDLSGRFRPDGVCLAMSHLFLAGGHESESERPIQLGGAYTVFPSALPAGAQYIGLGHLHRPQVVRAAPAPTRYAGSPLAYSFSEAGQAKSVVLVDVQPGAPAAVSEIPLSSGRPLVQWNAVDGLPQVNSWCEEGRDPRAWIDLELHVPVPLTMDEIQSLRRMNPGFVHIRAVLPQAEIAASSDASRKGLPLDELFRHFYMRQTGGALPDNALVELFLDLLGNDGNTGEAGE